MVVRSSYLHNGISYASKMTPLYWIGAQLIVQSGYDSDLPHFILWLQNAISLTKLQRLLLYSDRKGVGDINVHIYHQRAREAYSASGGSSHP